VEVYVRKNIDRSIESLINLFFNISQLAFLTRENFRQNSPVHVRRSSMGSSCNTPEKSLYNKLHEDPKVKASQYSGVRQYFFFSLSPRITYFTYILQHNRRVQKISQIAFGSTEDPTLESEKKRSWNRVRAAVPGTSSFRFFHQNPSASPSALLEKSKPKASFKYVCLLSLSLSLSLSPK